MKYHQKLHYQNMYRNTFVDALYVSNLLENWVRKKLIPFGRFLWQLTVLFLFDVFMDVSSEPGGALQ